MQALLDTNAFLWWAADDPRLSATARETIQDPDNAIFFSVASAWEIIIKTRIGKLTLPESPESYIPTRVDYYCFQILPIEIKHVLQIWKLDSHHKDPFDRVLIAQSQVENLPIITKDAKISLYDIDILW
ncbi:MAG: type II toxin-antitoxin system VapC family toxin [Moorea sp. SIO2I5]|nr:type II toxin-antitoxin system VapC family toxin [Moorena sp. SIO2I5]